MTHAEHQAFLFALLPPISDHQVGAIRDVVEAMQAAREWVVAPPAFVDETDSSSCTQPDDEPIRTAGCLLFVPRHASDRATDLRALDDVEAVLEMLRNLSAESGVDIEVQFDDECIGEIERGVLDRSLRDGLLAPWRARFRDGD